MDAAPLIVTYRAERYRSPHRTYVVLGAPRGGTSVIAGALQLLGVPMGSVDGQHEDPIFHDEKNVGRMIKTIGERNQSHDCWGWKLPNTIYYYHRLARHLRNPVFLIVYRNPFDIFMSAAGKGDRGLDKAHFDAPAFHYARMHKIIAKHRDVPAHALSYEAICAAPGRFVDELAALLPLDIADAPRRAAHDFIDRGRGYSALAPSASPT